MDCQPTMHPTRDKGPICDSRRRIDMKNTLLREPSTLGGPNTTIGNPLLSFKSIDSAGISTRLLKNEERFQGFFVGTKHKVIYSPPDVDSTIHLFKTLVRIYTAKHSSFDSDTLNAFNAIAMSFSRPGNYPAAISPTVQRTVLNLGGISFASNPDGLQTSLRNGLLWSHDHGLRVRQRRCFPSWTGLSTRVL
ncbi:hypothetical protein F4803DRAFT_259588 [Xylaria telfairii]|nr:hypothetical protein F4803DRAFT_259588 [Xylaria telfairii]